MGRVPASYLLIQTTRGARPCDGHQPTPGGWLLPRTMRCYMTTPHDPAHDPHTGKRRVGMSMLYGSLRLEEKIKYCERTLNKNIDKKIKAIKLALTTMDKDDWRYKNWSHYVTVMPDVVAWTRAEYSRLLALRDRPRRPRRRKVKS